MHCPKCRYDGVRLAQHKWFDLVPALFAMQAWRCGGCRARFYQPTATVKQKTAHRRSWLRKIRHAAPRTKRMARELTILIAALLIFLFLIRFIVMERGSTANASIITRTAQKHC